MLRFRLAGTDDAAVVAAIQTAAACDLARRFGPGPWAREWTERGVLAGYRRGQTWLAEEEDEVVATFRVGTRKPWAIDPSYFTPATRPLYLTDMAVRPASQGRGAGRSCMARIEGIAVGWPADAVWLDAYDAPAGAAGFYSRCGFREVARVAYRGTPLVYLERRIRPR